MSAGIDPDAEKKIQKQATITLREVLDVYLATKQLKPSTINCYRLSGTRDYIDGNVPMPLVLGWINLSPRSREIWSRIGIGKCEWNQTQWVFWSSIRKWVLHNFAGTS